MRWLEELRLQFKAHGAPLRALTASNACPTISFHNPPKSSATASCFHAGKLISDQKIAALLSGKNSGFHVHADAPWSASTANAPWSSTRPEPPLSRPTRQNSAANKTLAPRSGFPIVPQTENSPCKPTSLHSARPKTIKILSPNPALPPPSPIPHPYSIPPAHAPRPRSQRRPQKQFPAVRRHGRDASGPVVAASSSGAA